MKLILATRGSPLALWQAGETRRLLLAAQTDLEVELLPVQSGGDRDRITDLSRFGRTGIFTAEVDEAVLSGRAHAGVHSLKDVPTRLPEGLELLATLQRAPAEDALLSRAGLTLAELPRGARVATGSVRRRAQLKHVRPDLELCGIRGNVDTRLSKLAAGEADALVMARAGLERLGYSGSIREILPLARFLPAPGQGIVGVIGPAGSPQARLLASIGDADSLCAAAAERTLLHALHGGCNAPVGAHARVAGGRVTLDACVLSLDGSERLDERGEAPAARAAALGSEVAQRLIARGAKRLIDAARQQ